MHRLEVSDTGVGLLPDQLEQLFDLPVQDGARWLGVGLPLCRRLLEWMGGTLTVDSTFGAGTTFTIRLPAAADVTRTVEITRSGPARPLAIVDRRPIPIREAIGEELARAGIRPVVWSDGDRAALAALDPRAIAVDLDDGDELLFELLDDPALAGVPIVAATASVRGRARTLPDGVAALVDGPLEATGLAPAVLLAERAVRGCVLIGDERSAFRSALIAASWTVLAYPEPGIAAEAPGVGRAALVVWVDAGPEDELPEPLRRLPTARVRSDADPQAQADAIAFALQGEFSDPG
jgi:hypothetical protein